jgi:hypothetical protein
MRRPEADALGLSFLDIICGGFGASLFLFIVFASLPIESTSGLSGSNQYVYLSANWRDTDAVLDLRIQRPDGRTIRVNDPAFSLSHDSSRLVSKTRPVDGGAWKALHTFGVDSVGNLNARDLMADAQGEWRPNGRSFSAQILGPCPGEWKVTLDYVNRAGKLGWFSSISNNLSVDVAIYSSDYATPLTGSVGIDFGNSGEVKFPEANSGTVEGTFMINKRPREDYSHCAQ